MPIDRLTKKQISRGKIGHWERGDLEKYQCKEVIRIIERMVKEMLRERRIILHRYFHLENSVIDIAAQMNIPVERVEEICHQAVRSFLLSTPAPKDQ